MLARARQQRDLWRRAGAGHQGRADQGRPEARRRHRPAHGRGTCRHRRRPTASTRCWSRWSSCAGCRRDLGSPRVFINQPAFTARLHRGRRREAEHARRRRQAVQPDQLLLRRDRAGRLQSLLGRAAVDHRQRDAAAAAPRSRLSRPRRLRGHRLQGPPHLRRPRSTGGPTARRSPSTSARRRARRMRSAS